MPARFGDSPTSFFAIIPAVMLAFAHCLFLAATLLSMQKGGVELELHSETKVIDPGRSVFVTLTLKSAPSVKVVPPDLRTRVRGFSLAEDFAGEPQTLADGSIVQKIEWKFIPEPYADDYKIAPFVISVEGANDSSFVAGPVYFEKPAAREPVTGGMEIDPRKDLPPFSWRLVGVGCLVLLAAGGCLVGIYCLVKYLARRVKEHRMSPIERAWVELDRLLKRDLPRRGKYKDFYVELTMVVRRYVQRKYGIRAPNLTTEEFFAELRQSGRSQLQLGHLKELESFLESADMVKFAGVEATPEMAASATESARNYLKNDSLASGSAAIG